jgi:hypothetical protein
MNNHGGAGAPVAAATAATSLSGGVTQGRRWHPRLHHRRRNHCPRRPGPAPAQSQPPRRRQGVAREVRVAHRRLPHPHGPQVRRAGRTCAAPRRGPQRRLRATPRAPHRRPMQAANGRSGGGVGARPRAVHGVQVGGCSGEGGQAVLAPQRQAHLADGLPGGPQQGVPRHHGLRGKRRHGNRGVADGAALRQGEQRAAAAAGNQRQPRHSGPGAGGERRACRPVGGAGTQSHKRQTHVPRACAPGLSSPV